jgi:hypothetical protein
LPHHQRLLLLLLLLLSHDWQVQRSVALQCLQRHLGAQLPPCRNLAVQMLLLLLLCQ